MIYFISDTHFNHENIIKYCNRPFKNIKEMKQTIIENWNEVIKEDDVVYHLGDLALGRKENIYEITSKLKGIKYIIRGNHDKWSAKIYEELGFRVLKNPPIQIDNHKLLLSHIPIPDKQIPEEYINLHGHIHNKNLYECIEKYESNLYSLDKHINISCDITEFRPISIEKIKSFNK